MKYNAINAKVSGMSAKLLSHDDYISLYNYSSTQDVIMALKSHIPYARLTNDWTSIETQTFSFLDDDYGKTQSFINDNSIRKYLESLLMKRQIILIKKELRTIYEINTDRDNKLTYLQVQEFIQTLKGNKIYELLKSSYRGEMTLAQLEILLDLHYYTNLWKAKSRYLSGFNRVVATKVNGTEIDMYNIVRLYGLKKHYKPSKDLMYKYILPINYRISPETIHQLIETSNEAAMLELIRNTCYGVYFEKEEGGSETLYKSVGDACRRARRRNPNSIALIIQYLFKKEMELRRIISIIESVNYKKYSFH